MKRPFLIALFGAMIFLSASEEIWAALPEGSRGPSETDRIAQSYVKLVLSMGQHDADYVDAYYGPAEWQKEAVAVKKPLGWIASESARLRAQLAKVPAPAEEIGRLRLEYLTKQLSALEARVRIVQGERMKFDQESRALYDTVAPTYPDSHFAALLAKLESKIPGDGPLTERYAKWHKAFIIPKEKLDTVFQLAIKECRARTLAHVALPPNEGFTVQYVTNKPWGGYNWYKGNYHSVIEVNTDLPTYVDRAIDLAAHEGYPGHHVYNTLLEKNLVHDRGWVEYSIYPLYSPQSLVAEGTANFGREIVFVKTERIGFEKKVLWPAAGLDPAGVEPYYAVQDLLENLSYASNEAARRLVNGETDEKAAAAWLEKYSLLEPSQAEHRVRFIEHYRSYVINYNLGEDMVRHFIEKRSGTDPEDRWQVFAQLLSSPRLPSGLSQ